MLSQTGALTSTVWMPQPGSQTLFLNSESVFEVLLEGNRGGGKTDALIMGFLKHVGQGYGIHWRGIIFRMTYPQLKDVITKSKKWIPRMFPAAKFNESSSTWKFPDGEELIFSHMRVPDDYNNFHGHEYPYIGWEELTNWPNSECYTRMMTCCRSDGPAEMPRIIRATTNPYGPGFTWVKKRFKLPSHRFKVWRDTTTDPETGVTKIEKPRLAIQSRLSENKIFLAKNPGYVDTLRTAARNEAELKAWLYGSWDIAAGSMFDDVIVPEIHFIPSVELDELPRGWRFDRALDWGSSAPFSYGLYAESDGQPWEHPITGQIIGEVRGDIIRVREWYGTTGKTNEGLGLTATEFAEGVREREQKWGVWGRVKPGPADHNIFGESGRDQSDHAAMRKKGIRFDKAKKGPGSRKKGWSTLRDRFVGAIPDELGYREEPGLYIMDCCRYFIDIFPSLPRDSRDPDDIDGNSEDHLGDEISYRVRKIYRGGGQRGF